MEAASKLWGMCCVYQLPKGGLEKPMQRHGREVFQDLAKKACYLVIGITPARWPCRREWGQVGSGKSADMGWAVGHHG